MYIKYAALALAVALVAAPAFLFGQDPPFSLIDFGVKTIRDDFEEIVRVMLTALAGIFGLLFSIVIIRFAWKYVRGAFCR